MPHITIDGTPLLHGERAIRRVSRNLLKSITRMKCVDWRAFYFDRKGNTPGRLRLENEVICQFPVRLMLPSWNMSGWPTLETLTGDGADLFYATDLYFPPSRKTTILSTVHGIAYLVIPELCLPEHVTSLTKAFSYARQHADYFLAVSESTREDMLNHTDIPADRIYVSTHGVDSCFHPIEKQAARAHVTLRYGVERPYFLYVGVVAAHKNVKLLVDAMIAVSNMQDTDLILIGPWQEPFTSELRAYTKAAGLSERVHFVGSIEQESDELTYLYSGTIAFLFPTFYEGCCSPPLEAMACGAPVISTTIPSVQEVTGNAAVLLPVNDAEAWGSQMKKMAEDSQWRALMIKQGLIHVQQHTWEHSAKKLLSIMQEVIGREM